MMIDTPWRWVAAVLMLSSSLLARPARAADNVILTADYWCPHTCDPASGRSGYMIDIAREAFALADLRLVYQMRPWASGLAEVRSGLADGIVGTLPTEAPDLHRNQLTLGRQINAFVVRADDTFVLSGLDSLLGKRIATVQDYSYSTAIDSWLAAHPDHVLALAGNHAAEGNLHHLIDHRADVVVDDEAVLRDSAIRTGNASKIRTAGRLPGGSLHVAFSPVRHNDGDLAKILDDGITVLRRNGRLAEILASYGLADWE